MKYNCRYIFTGLLLVLLAQAASAQITVGEDVNPEAFSMIQVESKASIRLPRITEAGKSVLQTELINNPESAGLTFYNLTTGKLEFWDGQGWFALIDTISANNGLNREGHPMKLGGKLDKASTAVDLNNFNLNHELSASGSRFVVNDTMVIVNNRIVDIRPVQKFAVNDTVISIAGKTIDFRPSGLNINNGTLEMTKDFVGINGKLQYKDGNENSGYLLTCDENGNSYWSALRPLGAVIEGRLNNNAGFALTEADITTKAINLPPGQWLLFGKYTGKMNAAPDGMAHWILLKERPEGSASFNEVTRNGANPESKAALGGSYSYSTPNLLYYANITKNTEYRIYANTSNNRSDKTTDESWAGKSYFFAVRLDIPVYP